MENKIITISREFGSGGREVGKRLSDQLNIPYFDREILDELSQRLNMDSAYLEKLTTEKHPFTHTLHFSRSFRAYSQVSRGYVEVLGQQHKLLKEIAERESCVIVGRGANAILQGRNTFSIFVYAEAKSKLERCRARETAMEHLSERELASKMREIDRARARTQELFSPHPWGEIGGYHLCVNTSGREIKSLIPAITSYITAWFGGEQDQ